MSGGNTMDDRLNKLLKWVVGPDDESFRGKVIILMRAGLGLIALYFAFAVIFAMVVRLTR